MQGKHTPGPWAYEPTSGAIYYADGDVEPEIAVIDQDNMSSEQADADGRLIAAAPDLLAALRRAEFEIHNPGTNANDGVDIAELIRAAITRAAA